MISYGTAKVSAAWKLYAKSQGVPFEIANAVSDQIKRYETALKHADEDEKDDIDPFDYISKEYREIFSKSKDYQGMVNSWSIAPCSYLLYQGSIRREIGLVRVKDHLCCVMDGHWAEECHFLKNDQIGRLSRKRGGSQHSKLRGHPKAAAPNWPRKQKQVCGWCKVK